MFICRKTMMGCPTPGMCSPFGGCSSSVVPVAPSPVEFNAQQVRDKLWALVRDKRRPNAPWTYRTQAELAAAIGVSLPFVNDILNAKREPSGEVLTFLGLERVVMYRASQRRGDNRG